MSTFAVRRARAWLVIAMVVSPGGLGCLVTDSPDFPAPKLAGPYLKAQSPNTYEVQRETFSQAQLLHRLRFEVASEDLGTQPLQGEVVIDFPGYGVPYPDQLDHRLTRRLVIAPGHLEDEPRVVETDAFALGAWPAGCHSVSVIVAHEFANTLTITPAEGSPVATLTWWYLLGDPGDPATQQATNLGNCYTAPTFGDGGSDSQSAVAP